MSTIVIMPGGFHPYHAGHHSLYNSALKAFPSAEVYVAATNDTKSRPFPFAIKEKLAKVAGVAPGHFIQVKSPFQPREITDKFNPEQDVVIFVRSEKDRNESPKPGGTKKDGSPAYFQPYTGKDIQPFGQHAYMAYLPTVEFGPGISSATEIRNAWPTLNNKRKTAMVMSLYPATQKNPKLATNVVKMLDMGMGNELAEGWKNAVAGGAMALSALGAGAQTMPNVNPQQVELANKYYNVLVQRAKEDGRELDRRTLNFLKAKAENAAALKIQQSSTQSQPQSQPQQGFPTQGSERKVSKDVNNFESKELNEFVPPSSDRGDGGGENDRSRRIRKLLEIAIQVAKEKNVDELGMIHAMNMIAGDDFFSVAVEGILPDITDKEYMFVLQSAYKTVKQGLAEGLLREFAPSGQGERDSGRWYTDDELADIIGDDWFEDFDVSHDEFNIDTHGEKAKQNLASYANSWFDDRGYNVNVMGVEHNDVDHDLKWYIEGSFHNPRFAEQGVAEGLKHTLRKFDPTIKARILAKSQDQTDQGLDTIAQLADMGLTSDDMISRAMKPNTYFKNAERYAKLLAKKGVAEAEKTAKVFHPQYVDVYYLDGPRRTPLLVNRKVPYKLIDRYLEVVIKKYNLQKGRFEFRNAEEDPVKVTESVDYLEEK